MFSRSWRAGVCIIMYPDYSQPLICGRVILGTASSPWITADKAQLGEGYFARKADSLSAVQRRIHSFGVETNLVILLNNASSRPRLVSNTVLRFPYVAVYYLTISVSFFFFGWIAMITACSYCTRIVRFGTVEYRLIYCARWFTNQITVLALCDYPSGYWSDSWTTFSNAIDSADPNPSWCWVCRISAGLYCSHRRQRLARWVGLGFVRYTPIGNDVGPVHAV